MIRTLSSRRSFSPHGREAGLTLIELIVTVAILSLLASAAVPLARWNIKRVKERELRSDLWEMRRDRRNGAPPYKPDPRPRRRLTSCER